MKTSIFSILLSILFLFSLNAISQENKPSYNFSFEKFDSKIHLPVGWFSWSSPDYTLNLDSASKRDGKYSVRIEPKKDKKAMTFGCIACAVPVNFKGKQVKLTGKLKLENVAAGSAGLLLRIDGKNGVMKFDNMLQKNISGTIDWMEYTVDLPLDDDAKIIYAGAILNGTGKLWADDFILEIDGKDITTVDVIPAKTFNAELDKEFFYRSDIVIKDLNEKSADNLYQLAKIWGFLKYYHPKIAEGEYNWDNELFRIIPKVTSAASDAERDRIFVDWINSLGPITEFNDKNISDVKNVTIMPDLDWTNDGNVFSAELIAKLQEVRKAKRTDDPYYIGLYPEIFNPKFKNESPDTQAILDDGYRLLGLFRYWNMIQYFFPYKNLTNEDWNLVLKEFIPKFVNDKSALDYYMNSLQLIARVHDTHANIWGNNPIMNEYKGKNIAAPFITFIEDKAIVTGYFSLLDSTTKNITEIKIGDEITSVNGKSVTDIIQEKLPLTPASNYPTQLRDIAFSLLRTNDASISVEVNSDGKTETKNLQTNPMAAYDMMKYYSDNNKKSWSMINKDIGYIYPATIKNNTIPDIMKAFKDTKGIIIDFRCYPSDFFVFELGRYLMPKPTEFVKFRIGNLDFPGLFSVMDYDKVGEENIDYYKGKIIIIVNESTQSSAEYHTMSLRTAPNAKVIGSTTAGADGNVSQINLPGGISTMISGIGVLTPEGKETQRVGIIPDVEVKRTVKGVKEGKDELLLKAIEMIQN